MQVQAFEGQVVPILFCQISTYRLLVVLRKHNAD